MQDDERNQEGPDGRPLKDPGPETRTTGLEAPPERRLCRRCGGQVKGRRRNGYCSDRCRMRDRRDVARRELEKHLEQAERALAELRREVLS